MSSNNVLADKDVNAAPVVVDASQKGNGKNMEQFRMELQSKQEAGATQEFISPSDNLMSPCTAKLSTLKGKAAMKTKPRSLFAKASAKNLNSSDPMFGSLPSKTQDKDTEMSG